MSDQRITTIRDDYEIANLRAGLLTLRALNLDTGDWLGQILNRLPEATIEPNKSVDSQVAWVAALLARELADTRAENERLHGIHRALDATTAYATLVNAEETERRADAAEARLREATDVLRKIRTTHPWLVPDRVLAAVEGTTIHTNE